MSPKHFYLKAGRQLLQIANRYARRMQFNDHSAPAFIATEVYTAQIPEIYLRFAKTIGDTNWKNRVAIIKQEIRGNLFLEEHLKQENTIAMQLERIRMLFEKYGGIPSAEINNHDNYSAASFATQILSILDTSSMALAEQFRSRVRGAFRNPNDMRALRLELSAATHFARRGRKVRWPELAKVGSVDLYIEDVGPNGLEIECKSISEDKGRKVPKREVLDFYGLLWPNLLSIRKGLRVGLSAVLTVPARLPTSHKARQELAKQFARHILTAQNTTLEDRTQIRIGEFDLSRLPPLPSASTTPHEIRAAIDDVTSTRNRQTMFIGTEAGGALALTVQSADDDSMMKTVFNTLSDSAGRQFSGSRGGMFFTGFQGLDGKQLLSIAEQDNEPGQAPTALRLAVSKFLSSSSREHIVGVGFISESGLQPITDGLLESGGTAYYFPKRESPHWSDDYSGLFNWSRHN